ncbi:MAG: hypothetical protein WC955_08170 [Elusimicrobiota bacterium]
MKLFKTILVVFLSAIIMFPFTVPVYADTAACISCGAVNDVTNNFCIECGKPIQKPVESTLPPDTLDKTEYTKISLVDTKKIELAGKSLSKFSNYYYYGILLYVATPFAMVTVPQVSILCLIGGAVLQCIAPSCVNEAGKLLQESIDDSKTIVVPTKYVD